MINLENLRQLLYVVCVTVILTIQLFGLWRLLCFALGWDYLVEDEGEEDGDGE